MRLAGHLGETPKNRVGVRLLCDSKGASLDIEAEQAAEEALDAGSRELVERFHR